MCMRLGFLLKLPALEGRRPDMDLQVPEEKSRLEHHAQGKVAEGIGSSTTVMWIFREFADQPVIDGTAEMTSILNESKRVPGVVGQ